MGVHTGVVCFAAGSSVLDSYPSSLKPSSPHRLILLKPSVTCCPNMIFNLSVYNAVQYSYTAHLMIIYRISHRSVINLNTNRAKKNQEAEHMKLV